MAAAYSEDLGGNIEFAYNLERGEKLNFDYTKLDDVIKDKIDYLNMIRNDADNGGGLFKKLYGKGITKKKLLSAGDAASHAEILEMDKIIKRMRDKGIFKSSDDINKIHILVRGKSGWDNMPRCSHCFHLSLNAKIINNN